MYVQVTLFWVHVLSAVAAGKLCRLRTPDVPPYVHAISAVVQPFVEDIEDVLYHAEISIGTPAETLVESRGRMT